MERTILPNNLIKLSSAVGIIDKRTSGVHSVVVCSNKKEKFFEEVVIEEPVVVTPKRTRKKTSA